MTFRRRSGLPFSRPRMIMFGVTTFIFVLGIIALVLSIIFQFQATLLDNEQGPIDSSLLISFRGITTAWATVTRLMVRPRDALTSSAIKDCSVYSKRPYLRLAHSCSLGQRQAHYCHSSVLHLWGHRYVEGIHSSHYVLIWNQCSQLLPFVIFISPSRSSTLAKSN